MVTPSSRSDNCVLKPEFTNEIARKFQRVEGRIKRTTDENRFGYSLERVYHAEGHLVIGEHCKNNPNDFDSPMVFSEVSARDPVFYR